MFRRIFAIMLSGVLVFAALGFQPARAQTREDGGANGARAEVQKIGIGRDARVEVRLRDNTKVKGYVSAAEKDSFTVTDSKTGATQTVSYAEVTRVRKPGGGLSTRGWVIIGAAAVAAVIVGVTVIEPVLCDGGAGC